MGANREYTFTGNIGVFINRDGGLLNIIFSNFPNIIIAINSNFYINSNHEFFYIILRTRGILRPKKVNVSVKDDRLLKFAELFIFNMQNIPDPGSAADNYVLDAWVIKFTIL